MAGKKQNYNKSDAAAVHRQRKQSEALARKTERDKRSNEEQLALIRTRRGNSFREMSRLEVTNDH